MFPALAQLLGLVCVSGMISYLALLFVAVIRGWILDTSQIAEAGEEEP